MSQCRVAAGRKHGGENPIERAARLREEIAELAGKGVGPLSVAVRLGCTHREVRTVFRALGLHIGEDEDGTPRQKAARFGVSLEEYVRQRAAGLRRCVHHHGGKGAWMRPKEMSMAHAGWDSCKACHRERHPEQYQGSKGARWRSGSKTSVRDGRQAG